MSSGPGSLPNVVAALCSLCLPGLGQWVQGRLAAGLVMLVLAGLFWTIGLFGLIPLQWIIHLWSMIDAARHRPAPLPA